MISLNNLYPASDGRRIGLKSILGKPENGTCLTFRKNDDHITGGDICYFIADKNDDFTPFDSDPTVGQRFQH